MPTGALTDVFFFGVALYCNSSVVRHEKAVNMKPSPLRKSSSPCGVPGHIAFHVVQIIPVSGSKHLATRDVCFHPVWKDGGVQVRA